MINTPLVSIIIPTFNRAHLIGETLDSVLAQTYTNWECIVVDDGSTDDTEGLLQHYCKKDSRLQFHQRPKDRPKGANACRNYGFELCKGEYVNFFDSDDLMLKEKLKIQVNQLHRSTFDFVICQTEIYDFEKKKKVGLVNEFLKSENAFEDYILKEIFWLIEAPLWSRKFLELNNLQFDESLQQSQDYDFHIKVLNISTNYEVINLPLVLVLKHNANLSSLIYKDPRKIMSNVIVLNRILTNYNTEISPKALIQIFNSLVLKFKYSLNSLKFKDNFKVYRFLILNLKFLTVHNIRKSVFFIQLTAFFISFKLFSRGGILFRNDQFKSRT